jgi:hypothetical protein
VTVVSRSVLYTGNVLERAEQYRAMAADSRGAING